MPMLTTFRRRLTLALPHIIEKFGTPFHIYDEAGIRGTLRTMQDAFVTHDFRFKEFYAVKALPKPAIMDIVKSEGCGFDCSSIPELRLARAAGAKPEDIMFTSNNTSREEFDEALAYGGCILNLDGIEYIEVVKSLLGRLLDLICFRLNPGSRKTGDAVNTIIGNPLEAKYGVPIEKIIEAYRLAREAGAKRFGLHTMVCSNDQDYTHMVATYQLLLEVAVEIKRNLGIELEFINVGGGLGIPYRPNDKGFDFQAYAKACIQIGHEFRQLNGYLPNMYMESGRFITGPHGVLVNRVINVYDKYKHYAGVEVAMPALMRVGMYSSAYHHCTLLQEDGTPVPPESRPIIKVTVAGSICENCDVLARDIELPEPRVGDIIITHDTGAHGSAMGFNYNGRCRPQELLFGSMGWVRRICRAETYNDLQQRHYGLEGDEHSLKIPFSQA